MSEEREDVSSLMKQGDEALGRGDWEEASRRFKEVQDILEGDPEGDPDQEKVALLAEALRSRAFADSRIGEIERAVSQAKRSLDMTKGLGDDVGQADALRRLGYIHWLKGEVEMAQEFYAKALEMAEGAGADDLVGRTRIEIANALNMKGDLTPAKEEYIRAIDILTETGNKNELARAYNNLGDCYMRMGELEEAIESLRRCMDIATEIGDLTIKGWAGFNAADCFTKMGETGMAKEYLDMALEFLELSDDRIGVANVMLVYGRTFLADRESVLAEDAFNKSYAIATELEMPGLEAEIMMAKAEMFRIRGEIPVSRDLLERARDIFNDIGNTVDADEATKKLKDLDA